MRNMFACAAENARDYVLHSGYDTSDIDYSDGDVWHEFRRYAESWQGEYLTCDCA